MKDYSNLFSEVVSRSKASVIRELLKLLDTPDIISFAGGLPAPTEFPKEDISKVLNTVLEKNAAAALQYGTTEGCTQLRDQLAKWLKEQESIEISPDDILITSASQQALDMIGRLFINPGDDIVVTNPTYLGALQVFQAYDAKMHGADSDEQGVIPASLEARLKEIKDSGRTCKFVYLVPDFQNPTGVTIPQERRLEILEILKKYNVLLIEDSPYRQVRFEGEAPDTFFKLDNGEGNVITLFTFSKIFVPGFRLGYVTAPKQIIKAMVVLKQSMDLCTSPILQLATAEYIAQGLLAPHIQRVVDVYKVKRTAMLEALDKYMPKGVTWTKPEGGLFLWITLPDYMDSEKMFPSAVKEKVAYVVGSAFYYDGKRKNDLRINFSYATLEEIEEGMKRLGRAIEKNMK